MAAADSAYPAYSKGYEYVILNSLIFQNQFANQVIDCWNEQPARPYNFAYQVIDDPSYNNFGHSENSDGKVTSGSYNVLLPDGRTQTVTYKVDGYSGYVADVKYDGYAKPYEYKPAYKAAYPAPAYKAAYPAPAYP